MQTKPQQSNLMSYLLLFAIVFATVKGINLLVDKPYLWLYVTTAFLAVIALFSSLILQKSWYLGSFVIPVWVSLLVGFAALEISLTCLVWSFDRTLAIIFSTLCIIMHLLVLSVRIRQQNNQSSP